MQQTKRTRKLKVLFILNPERGAGAEMSLLEVAKCLDKNRYQVILGLLKDISNYKDVLIPQHMERIHFSLPDLRGGRFMLPFFMRLLSFLLTNDIHIIHVNSYSGFGNYARLAGMLGRVPIIIDHWRGLSRITPKRRLICMFLGRYTDLSLAISRSVRDHVVEKCRLPMSKFRVSYVGIDWACFQSSRAKENIRRELGLPLALPVVGIVARLDHWAKGHRELFRAMPKVQQHYPIHAMVVGGGRRKTEMEQEIANLGLSESVHFLGMRRDIPDLLAAMDIFVMPSYSEGLCRALLEAMAAGLPVIASKVGGMLELVRHEENGLLIPARDPSALAQALIRMLANPEWARSMGKKAQDYVRRHFSMECMARQINQIYDELVKKKLPRLYDGQEN